jgi:hypothetical protein
MSESILLEIEARIDEERVCKGVRFCGTCTESIHYGDSFSRLSLVTANHWQIARADICHKCREDVLKYQEKP